MITTLGRVDISLTGKKWTRLACHTEKPGLIVLSHWHLTPLETLGTNLPPLGLHNNGQNTVVCLFSLPGGFQPGLFWTEVEALRPSSAPSTDTLTPHLLLFLPRGFGYLLCRSDETPTSFEKFGGVWHTDKMGIFRSQPKEDSAPSFLPQPCVLCFLQICP